MTCRLFNCGQISAVTMTTSLWMILAIMVSTTTTVLAQTDSSDTDDVDVDDYNKGDTAYDYLDANTTTTSSPSSDYQDFGFGYKVKYQGLSNITHHKSLDDDLLIIRVDIGTNSNQTGGPVIRMENTLEETLWEIAQPYEDDADQKIKKWILVRPPGDVDVATLHWERNDNSHILVISGPIITNTNLGSSEARNKTVVFPSAID